MVAFCLPFVGTKLVASRGKENRRQETVSVNKTVQTKTSFPETVRLKISYIITVLFEALREKAVHINLSTSMVWV